MLCLELTDGGFDHTVLSEFRTRLLAHGAEERLFEAILDLARGRGLLKAGGRQRSDSTHVLGAMRTLSRLEVVVETLHHALNVLARTAPDWLRAHTSPAWIDRSGLRASKFRLPKSEAGRRAWAVQTGVDGFALLALGRANDALLAVRDSPALEILRQVWVQNFVVAHGPDGPRVAWRTNDLDAAVGPVHRLAVRCRGALPDQGRHRVERLQGPPHGDVRRHDAEPDHARRDDHHGSVR